jgi:GTP cyclohydrolase I
MATIPSDPQSDWDPVTTNERTTVTAAAMLLSQLVPKQLLATDGTKDTPARMAKALGEMLDGYDTMKPEELLTFFDAEGYDQIISVSGIPFHSLCEHHVLPFSGTVAVAYLPGDQIIGLSKLPRVVRALSRRLQVQERLTKQIADVINKASPKGVAVYIKAHHTCMSARGVESEGIMETSVAEGVFRDHPGAKAEVLGMLKG